jgi:hypothetical protein
MLFSNYTYKLFNGTYVFICIYTYLLNTYLPMPIGYLIINNYLESKYVPRKNLCYLVDRLYNSMC